MEQIPDDPRIREAEMYGVPEPDPVHCPICGAECEWVYLQSGDPFGCENCITKRDAYEWQEEHMD